jgi:hypothetical protein
MIHIYIVIHLHELHELDNYGNIMSNQLLYAF